MLLFAFALLSLFVLERLRSIRSAVNVSSKFQTVGNGGRGGVRERRPCKNE